MNLNAGITAIVQTFRDLANSHADHPIPTTKIEQMITAGEAGSPSPHSACLVNPRAAVVDPRVAVVDVYDWIGRDEVTAAFQGLIGRAKSWPLRAIYAADVLRTIIEIEHRALLEAAEARFCDRRLLTRSDDLPGARR